MKSKNIQCDGCAFKPGGEANKEPYNSLRAHVCALGPIPFYCHHDVDWRAQHGWSASQVREQCRVAGVCGGWTAEVQRLHARGFYNNFRVIRQAVAKQCLMAIELFTNDTNTPKQKLETRKLLFKMVRFLASKDITHKKIPLLWG